MLRQVKVGMIDRLARAGVFERVAGSAWRRRRLLILGYHGVARAREHEWKPGLYMTEELLRERFRRIRDGGYRVLRYSEAIARARRGELPPGAVTLTFDDGGVDFHEVVMPLLREFGFPATVFLTTYYCEKRSPIFPLMCSYMLWSAPAGRHDAGGLFDVPFTLDLGTPGDREATFWKILSEVRGRAMPGHEKQALLHRLADALGIDYAGWLDRRLFRIMDPEQVAEVARAGIDVQLHSHRHRTPDDPAALRAEIAENASAIESMTGRRPRHFAYTSGSASPRAVDTLRATGIHSAVTSRSGLVTRRTDRLRLPRLLDHAGLRADEFDGWLSGAASFLSRHAAEPTLRPGSQGDRLAALPTGDVRLRALT